MQASPSPSVLIWKSCHSPNYFITCFEAILCFMDFFLMGTQNWELHLGRRWGIFPESVVFDILCSPRSSGCVFPASSYSKTLSEHDFLSGSQLLASWPQWDFSLPGMGRSPGAAKTGPQGKGTLELGAGVPHHLLIGLQLLQRCHSPGKLAKTALTLERLANPTHFLT